MNKYRDVAKNNHAVPDVFFVLVLQAICGAVFGDTTSAALSGPSSGRPSVASGRHGNVTSNPTQDSVFISQFTGNDMNT